jgi:Ca2+-binding EF-hand superfamily protein
MRISLAIAAIIGCWLATLSQCADERAADGDTYDLVLLAPNAPVFLRLHIQLDGASLKTARRGYAELLLAQHDENTNGVLEKDEARKIPPLLGSAGMRDIQSVSESWVAVDCNPADDRVSIAELADWIDRVLGAPFALTARSMRATQSIDLFGRLDLDGNGRLSHDELRKAEQTLRKLDLDEDETFTVDELAPVPVPPGGRPANDRGESDSNQPFLLLGSDEAIFSVARQLVRRYGGSPDANHLDGQILALGKEALAHCDVDGDGRLSLVELEQMLNAPPPHIELLAELVQTRPGRTKLTLLHDRLQAHTAAGEKRPDRLTLETGDLSVHWRIEKPRVARSDNRKMAKLRFLQADRDKNKYLDEQEFSGLGIPDATFSQVDLDGNAMIAETELLAYVEQEASASQCQVILTVSHEGKSVFEALDENTDRRITRRELRRAIELLRGFDRNDDGEVTAIELSGHFRAGLELGQPLLIRNTESAPGSTGQTDPIVTRPRTGPDWFIKMDRNRDGDVSRQEFLGPLNLFRQLDTDGDGLIAASEAEANAAR